MAQSRLTELREQFVAALPAGVLTIDQFIPYDESLVRLPYGDVELTPLAAYQNAALVQYVLERCGFICETVRYPDCVGNYCVHGWFNATHAVIDASDAVHHRSGGRYLTSSYSNVEEAWLRFGVYALTHLVRANDGWAIELLPPVDQLTKTSCRRDSYYGFTVEPDTCAMGIQCNTPESAWEYAQDHVDGIEESASIHVSRFDRPPSTVYRVTADRTLEYLLDQMNEYEADGYWCQDGDSLFHVDAHAAEAFRAYVNHFARQYVYARYTSSQPGGETRELHPTAEQ